MGVIELTASLPGAAGAGFAARVRQLDAGHRALRGDKARDPRQRLDLRVVPQPGVPRADPAIGRHGRRLANDQRRAAGRAAAQMNEMPIIGHAVLRGILAHRRDTDAIAQGDILKGELTEKVRRRHALLYACGEESAASGSRVDYQSPPIPTSPWTPISKIRTSCT
jgi:hypothetical protein